MEDQIPLPPPVESLIQLISSEQLQPLPEAQARRELAALGEEASLRLLSDIRKTKITRSFHGYILYMANQLRSPGSPGNSASPAPADVVLPTSVNEVIRSICDEQSQPPLGTSAKRKLALAGEEEALRALHTVRQSKISKSFDAFVIYLLKNDSPSSASPRQESTRSFRSFAASSASISSPSPCALGADQVTYSVQHHLTLSPISARQPGEPTFLPCKNNRQSNEQSPSHSSNVGTSNGQSYTPSTNVGKPNGQCVTTSMDIMNPRAQTLLPSRNVWKPSGQTSSPVLQALNELEFKKVFMILSYIGRNKLEEVTSAGEIKDLAAVQSMAVFENIIWNRFGSRYCEGKDRVKQVDWESGRRYYYHCYVHSDGSYSLKGPFLNKTATLLQKVLGDENVLLVKFYNLDSSRKNFGLSVTNAGACQVAKEGIFVGLKHFRFFVFKDVGNEEKDKKKSSCGAIKSYYVNVDSFARFYENEACFYMRSMHERRCIFMHVHNVSSLSAYMARFSLILSKTITLEVNLDDPDVHVEDIDDIPCKDANGVHIHDKDCKPQIHTDGTGFISEELALRCPRNCVKGSSLNDQLFQRYLELVQTGTATSPFIPAMLQPPLLIQFRMFHKGRAVKGTVLVNKKLQGKRIQVRPSMIKVKRDKGPSFTPAVNSFEIVSTSNRPRNARLSQFLIALLNYGGVPRDFFIGIVLNEIWDAQIIFSNKRAALKVALNHGEMDDNYTVARMILSGIPVDESYIQSRLSILGKQELTSLKKGKLPINDSFYLMGTADPTGSLNSNEVCIVHETGQLEGDVLVYRCPGVHFGDVHILKATRIKGLEDVVGTSKYGIFFPTNGPRNVADKMAGGDFDGDMYFVSRHPTLLTSFKQSEPWTPTPLCCKSTSVNRKPSEFTAEELEHQLLQLLLTKTFQPCFTAGLAANAWLSYMDELLSLGDDQKKKHEMESKMRRLVDIYYEALDAPKKGKEVIVPHDLMPRKYPHFMEKAKNKYNSSSVLGEIFDKATNELKMGTPAVQVCKLPLFDIEVPLQCIVSWEDHYTRYRKDMEEAMKSNDESKNDAASNIFEKYKQMLYEADEFENSPRAWEDIRFEALAIYHVVYGYAMQLNDVRKCGFAWKVAGPALMKIFMEQQDEKPVYCLPSVLREVI